MAKSEERWKLKLDNELAQLRVEQDQLVQNQLSEAKRSWQEAEQARQKSFEVEKRGLETRLKELEDELSAEREDKAALQSAIEKATSGPGDAENVPGTDSAVGSGVGPEAPNQQVEEIIAKSLGAAEERWRQDEDRRKEEDRKRWLEEEARLRIEEEAERERLIEKQRAAEEAAKRLKEEQKYALTVAAWRAEEEAKKAEAVAREERAREHRELAMQPKRQALEAKRKEVVEQMRGSSSPEARRKRRFGWAIAACIGLMVAFAANYIDKAPAPRDDVKGEVKAAQPPEVDTEEEAEQSNGDG